eukprot:2884539-Pyramimonas_sp.AAC.1
MQSRRRWNRHRPCRSPKKAWIQGKIPPTKVVVQKKRPNIQAPPRFPGRGRNHEQLLQILSLGA